MWHFFRRCRRRDDHIRASSLSLLHSTIFRFIVAARSVRMFIDVCECARNAPNAWDKATQRKKRMPLNVCGLKILF